VRQGSAQARRDTIHPQEFDIDGMRGTNKVGYDLSNQGKP
jgi:hypothetical protein